ncbi:NUDIX domain-containing protein [Bacillus cereus]
MIENVSIAPEQLVAAKKIMETDVNLSGIYIFYSFDLVNSTSFKAKFTDGWPEVVEGFYALVKEKLMLLHNGVKVWKYIGDEVLFYKRLSELQEMHEAPRVALKVIRYMNEELSRVFPNSKKLLDIKATIWLAPIDDKTKQQNKYMTRRNLVFQVDGIRGDGRKDFLGPDIDMGFRLCKHAHKQKVLVSPELAYLIWLRRDVLRNIEKKDRYDIDESLKIVSYEKMKGIWDDRLYPIIYFFDKWDKVEEIYEYDDLISPSPVLQNMTNKRQGHFWEIKYLERILSDLGKKEEVESFIDVVEDTEPINDERTIIPLVPVERISEVHCVAVCFNNEGEILLGKRPKTKRVAAGKWEFGCGQLSVSKDFESALVTSYQKDFGVRINFGSELRPVRIFQVPNPIRAISGIIFIAKTENRDIQKNSHDEVIWFNPNDIQKVDLREYVDDFEKSVRVACKAALEQFPQLKEKIFL